MSGTARQSEVLHSPLPEAEETAATGKRLALYTGESESLLSGLIRLARPKDWIKNVFVLVPVPFAWVAAKSVLTPFVFDPAVFLLGLAGFCLINSAAYSFNDLRDAESDRLHARKCRRPIAAGIVPLRAAWAQIVVLLLAGGGLMAATGNITALEITLTYVIINVIYTLGAKHIALLDVFLLASGFTIRVLLGVALVGAMPSAWLLLCTSSLALFLGFTKRRGDLAAGVAYTHRPSLRGYTVSFLDHAMLICAGVAIMGYALYSIESKIFAHGREMASLPFVAYGILNYLRLAETENAGDSPVDIAYTSRSSQLCVIAWIIAVTWSLGIW
jgi:4-hydroxybenzoate polyprenyltransferase